MFTDKDLKKLKEEHLVRAYGCAHMDEEHVGLHDVLDDKKFKALLDRLEAAEAILNNGVALTHQEDCDKLEHCDLSCTCGAQNRWNRWRTAAKKGDGG